MAEPARRPPPRAARSVGTTTKRATTVSRGQTTFAILGLLVIISMVFGLVATGYIFDNSAAPSPDTGLRPPGNSGLVPTYEARLQANPNDSGAMIILANTLQNQGDYPGAIAWYEKAVALKPDDVDLRLAFGQALFNYGQLFDAEVQYKKAIEINPKSAQAEYYLAELYQQWVPPRLAEAQQHFQRASELEPEGSWGRAARAMLERLSATPPAATATP